MNIRTHIFVYVSVQCWSVLKCVAVCCRVLQCVALCCTVLQCVAVCCSELQCVSVHRRTQILVCMVHRSNICTQIFLWNIFHKFFSHKYSYFGLYIEYTYICTYIHMHLHVIIFMYMCTCACTWRTRKILDNELPAWREILWKTQRLDLFWSKMAVCQSLITRVKVLQSVCPVKVAIIRLHSLLRVILLQCVLQGVAGCVQLYIYIYTWIYISIYINIHIYIYTYMYKHIYIYIYI